MKTFRIFITAATVALFTSCAGLLDIPQHGTLTYDTYYQTDEEAETGVSNLYLTLRGLEYNLKLTKHLLCDDFWAGGGGRGDNADLEALNEFTFNTEQGFLQGVFQSYYQMIYQANVVLGHVKDDTPVKQQMLAEARVFRALAYFDLISMWGNPPLVDHELTPSEYAVPNGKTEELWALVESDLTLAINSGMLAEKTGVNDTETWRVTKQFAQALLGKAYLWQEKYKDAADCFDAVIRSGLYELYRGPYEDILQYTTAKNCESIFESVKIKNPNNTMENFSFYLTMVMWRTDKMTGVQEAGFSNMGWGFCAPKAELYNLFFQEEGPDGVRLNGTMKTYDQMKDMSITIMPGASMINEGYFFWKWRLPQSAEDGGWSSATVHVNTRWMRLAEVYLLGAEAHLLANNAGTAADYLNKVRERVGLRPKNGISLQDIQTEKRLELCGEGVRFQDIVRWKIAKNNLEHQGDYCPFLNSNGVVDSVSFHKDPSLYGFKDKHYLLPYPAAEIRLNTNIKQNPGW
ncbi:MAG: RagB/SusD family nutrient uptake outer membrane protein [Bacteroidales bacterium]|nr:RagB/SusD family nutrient uptake outer membrane protein [Bacteroidales bacterium]